MSKKYAWYKDLDSNQNPTEWQPVEIIDSHVYFLGAEQYIHINQLLGDFKPLKVPKSGGDDV